MKRVSSSLFVRVHDVTVATADDICNRSMFLFHPSGEAAGGRTAVTGAGGDVLNPQLDLHRATMAATARLHTRGVHSSGPGPLPGGPSGSGLLIQAARSRRGGREGTHIGMSTAAFGLTIMVAALAGVAAVLSSRVSERLRIPAAAFFLVAAAAASDIWPRLGGLSFTAVENVVSVALAVILFDGGMRMGWRRLRGAAGPTLWIGVAGTLVTAVGVAAVARVAFGLDWRGALLLGAAIAPTDPAIVFSVLGRREIAGRGGALLEGESGSNDPVSIALIAALLATQGTGLAAAGHV